MNTAPTTDTIETLGYAIEARGINADPVALLVLAHTARDLGVDNTLVNVMVDEQAPSNVRVRAFARVSSSVSVTLSDRLVASTHRELLHAC